MGDVLQFTGETISDLKADDVLEAAKGKLERVIIIGVTKEDQDFHAVSTRDIGDVFWLIDRFKHRIHLIADGEL